MFHDKIIEYCFQDAYNPDLSIQSMIDPERKFEFIITKITGIYPDDLIENRKSTKRLRKLKSFIDPQTNRGTYLAQWWLTLMFYEIISSVMPKSMSQVITIPRLAWFQVYWYNYSAKKWTVFQQKSIHLRQFVSITILQVTMRAGYWFTDAGIPTTSSRTI